MIEESIYSALVNHAGLAALVATKVYPLRIPQGTALPAITYTRISGARLNDLDGENIQNPRYQIDIYAASYGSAKAIAAQVQAAFKAASFTNILLADRDNYDDAATVFHVSMDYSIWSV